MTAPAPALQLLDLRKNFVGKVAVGGVSLSVPAGELYALRDFVERRRGGADHPHSGSGRAPG